MTNPHVARYEAQRIFVEGCRARFPDLREPWLHQSDDGLRLWLTDGEHGPVLAETTLPPCRRRPTMLRRKPARVRLQIRAVGIGGDLGNVVMMERGKLDTMKILGAELPMTQAIIVAQWLETAALDVFDFLLPHLAIGEIGADHE